MKPFPERWIIRGWRFGIDPMRPDARRKGLDGRDYVQQTITEVSLIFRRWGVSTRVWWEVNLNIPDIPVRMPYGVILVEVYHQKEGGGAGLLARIDDPAERGKFSFQVGKENSVVSHMMYRMRPGWDGEILPSPIKKDGLLWAGAQQCMCDPYGEKPEWMPGPEGSFLHGPPDDDSGEQ